MQQQQKEQIMTILANLESEKKRLPYFSDLEEHPVFGGVFRSLGGAEKAEVLLLVDQYVKDKLEAIKKTKGGQLFNRFVEAHAELFWAFRWMNDAHASDENFQKIGKQVETEMFKLEGILTEKMLQQEKGLDKVIDSFYSLVYAFFPRFNEIE